MRRIATVCGFTFLGLFACKQQPKPAAPPVAPVLPPALASSVPPAAPGAPAKVEGAEAVLTEDKVTRFLTYQKEMMAVTSDAVAAGANAYQKGGADQKKFEKAMSADERTAKIAAASKSALEKSGLAQEDVGKLSRVLTPYYARVYASQMVIGKAGDKKPAAGKPLDAIAAAMEKAREGQSARLAMERKTFADEYGQAALDLVEKHEPEFLPINEQMMNAAVSGLMKKK